MNKSYFIQVIFSIIVEIGNEVRIEKRIGKIVYQNLFHGILIIKEKELIALQLLAPQS